MSLRSSAQADNRHRHAEGGKPVNNAGYRLSVRWLLALSAGLAVGIFVIWLRRAGALSGFSAVAVATLSLLVLPTARTLSGRIFITGAICLSWVQVLWWIPGVSSSPWRMTASLALACGAAATVASWRLRLALPRVRVVDVVPIGLLLFFFVLYRPILRRETSLEAMSFMLGGWDNVAHFAMVRQIIAYGATADMFQPDVLGARPAYAHYPQAFHATVASVMELRSPDKVQQISNQLPNFVQSSTIVILLVATVLVAGVCALPTIRRRPAWGLALALIAVSGLLLGIGYHSIADGFYNFLYACGFVGVVALAAGQPRAIGRPELVAVVAGGITAVAHSWILITPIALAAAFPLLSPRAISRARAARLGASLAILGCGAVASVRSIPIVLHVAGEDPFNATGGIWPASLGATVLGLCLVVTLALVARSRRGTSFSLVGILVASATAVGLVSSLIAYQLVTSGSLTYYSMKAWTAVFIITWMFIPLPVACLLRGSRVSRAWSAAGIALAMGITQFNGYLGPQLGVRHDPLVGMSQLAELPTRIAERDIGLDLAARNIGSVAVMQHENPDAFYVLLAAPPDNVPSTFLSNMWIRGLTLTWRQTTNTDILAGTPNVIDEQAPLGPVVQQVLDLRPEITVIVPEGKLAEARAGLSRQDAARVQPIEARPWSDLDKLGSSSWVTNRDASSSTEGG